MDEADAIVCIKNRRYLPAANFVVKGIYGEKIHTLGNIRRDRITEVVAKSIKDEHEYLRSWYADMGIKPREIAEEVYNKIIMELTPESTSRKSLSEQLEDDEQ